jgi:hypothetical protein
MLISLAGAGPQKLEKCHWMKTGPAERTLEFSQKKIKLSINGRSARLIKCESVKQYLLAEIDFGETGSFSKVSEIQLVIFDTSKDTLQEMFRQTIKRTTKDHNPTTKGIDEFLWENKYQLKRSKTGQWEVSFAKSKERFAFH